MGGVTPTNNCALCSESIPQELFSLAGIWIAKKHNFHGGVLKVTDFLWYTTMFGTPTVFLSQNQIEWNISSSILNPLKIHPLYIKYLASISVFIKSKKKVVFIFYCFFFANRVTSGRSMCHRWYWMHRWNSQYNENVNLWCDRGVN